MKIPGMLTADEAAARLGITRQSLYNLVSNTEDFPEPAKVGRASLWPEAALDEWRARHPKRNRSRS